METYVCFYLHQLAIAGQNQQIRFLLKIQNKMQIYLADLHEKRSCFIRYVSFFITECDLLAMEESQREREQNHCIRNYKFYLELNEITFGRYVSIYIFGFNSEKCREKIGRNFISMVAVVIVFGKLVLNYVQLEMMFDRFSINETGKNYPVARSDFCIC